MVKVYDIYFHLIPLTLYNPTYTQDKAELCMDVCSIHW